MTALRYSTSLTRRTFDSGHRSLHREQWSASAPSQLSRKSSIFTGPIGETKTMFGSAGARSAVRRIRPTILRQRFTPSSSRIASMMLSAANAPTGPAIPVRCNSGLPIAILPRKFTRIERSTLARVESPRHITFTRADHRAPQFCLLRTAVEIENAARISPSCERAATSDLLSRKFKPRAQEQCPRPSSCTTSTAATCVSLNTGGSFTSLFSNHRAPTETKVAVLQCCMVTERASQSSHPDRWRAPVALLRVRA